jgi:serine/threonine-protein kinase RsbW
MSTRPSVPDGPVVRELSSRIDPACVDLALDLLQDLWDEAGRVAEEDRTAVEIATVEVMANIVQHTVSADPLDVTLRVAVHPDRVEARFVDTGDRVHVEASPRDAQMPEALQEGGRGLALAGTVLDEISYTREGPTNCWLLVRRLRA